mgnify:FL=1
MASPSRAFLQMSRGIFCLIAMLFVSSASATEPRNIVFIGDSLTAGYGLDNPKAQAYPALIQEKIDAANLNYRAVNAGLSGDTTAGGLQRINWLLRQKIDILVVALGGNDGLRGVSPKATKSNLRGIIEKARVKYPDVVIILAGMQMPTNMGESYRESFRRIFPEVAQEKRCDLIPFLLDGVGGYPKFNQPDLIHPTAEGQQIMAQIVWLSLMPILVDQR